MRLSRLGVALTAAALTALTVSAGGVIAGEPSPAGSPAQTALTTVTDDTGTISLDVPVDWVVETSPTYYYGFYEVVPIGYYPTIRAHPVGADVGFGTRLMAQAFQVSSHPDVVESFYGDYGIGCDPSSFKPEVPFDNGVLSGEQHDTVGCHDVARHTIVADHGSNFTVAVDAASQSDADEAVIASVLSTIRPASDAPITGPMLGDPGSPGSFPFGGFRSVPQLGSEPVRGSGCGADGSIGDTIPDGIWAAFAGYIPDGNHGNLELDLLCVFTPEAAPGIIDDGSANIVNDDPNYLVVNNNTRTRTVGTVPDLMAHQFDFVATADGTCLAAPLDEGRDRTNVQAWVSISGGVVTEMYWDCVPLDASGAGGPATPTGNLPPAQPGDGVESFWPYSEFWNVPQLGIEPVRGSGCGGSGQIGDRIPDGLWAGYVSVDPANPSDVWVNLLCVYYGESAQAVRDAGTAKIVHDEPDYLIVDNNEQARLLTNHITAVAASAPAGSGRCVPSGVMMPPAGAYLPGAGDWFGADPSAFQAWIRVSSGAVTWLVYGCDTGFTPGG